MPKLLKVLIGVTTSVLVLVYIVSVAIDSMESADRGKLNVKAEARRAFVTKLSDGAFPKGERGMEVSTGGDFDTTLQFRMTFGDDELEHLPEIMKTQNETFADMAKIMMEPASRRGLCDLGFTSLSYEGTLPISVAPQVFNLHCGVKE